MTFSTISRTAPLARFTRRAALALAAAPLLIGSAMAQQAAWPDASSDRSWAGASSKPCSSRTRQAPRGRLPQPRSAKALRTATR